MANAAAAPAARLGMWRRAQVEGEAVGQQQGDHGGHGGALLGEEQVRRDGAHRPLQRRRQRGQHVLRGGWGTA